MLRVFSSLEVRFRANRVHYSLAADSVRLPRFACATEFPLFSRDIPTERFGSSFPPRLTQGYHQAPLNFITRAYTAFITFSGVYQFTRLPFGPKRAPSNFQEIMATAVLAGLIYMICEMYIDDCTVFGDTNIEFVSRL